MEDRGVVVARLSCVVRVRVLARSHRHVTTPHPHLAPANTHPPPCLPQPNSPLTPTYSLKDGSSFPDVSLAAGSSLRLQLTVTEKGEPAVPAYAAVQFTDADGRDAQYALGVKNTGKATFMLVSIKQWQRTASYACALRSQLRRSDTTAADAPSSQNADKLPTSLRTAVSPMSAKLLLSTPGAKPVSWSLGTVALPPAPADAAAPRRRHDLPPRANEPAFAPQPEITHTFRADEKPVALPKAAAGMLALIIVPWCVLFVLIGKISGGLNWVAPQPSAYLFMGCIAGLEGLILRYWAGWRLYQLLGPFLGLSAVTAYVGTVALRAARAERLKAGGTP